MLIAHKIALDPTEIQKTYFSKSCGVARFAYNWALAEWDRQYQEHKKDKSKLKPSEAALRRLLNSIKQERFPWMLEVTKNAPQMAIIQLGKAFKNFFAKRSKYPQYRRKGVHDRFTLTNDQFEIKGQKIRVPCLGWVRMRENLRFAGKILTATISRVADRWFVSVTVETSSAIPRSSNPGKTIGVDMGISAMATLSNGQEIVGPKPYQKLLNRLKKLSKSLSRKVKGSKNRAKAKTKLARIHARITNIRLDAIHKFTSDLVRQFDTICIEDLNVRKMVKNRHLSRRINDISFFEIRRQLEYKTAKGGKSLVIADRYFPSSKMCSQCGHVLSELALSTRQWNCPGCKSIHQRDLNAAINLAAYAVSSTVKACGGISSGYSGVPDSETVPMKQETNVDIYR